MRPLVVIALLLAAPLFVCLALGFGNDPIALQSSRPWLHREGGFVGAENCRACHLDHYASWRATFHATMTQLPQPEVVRGHFDGIAVPCDGGAVVPLARAGRFLMVVPAAAGKTREAEVALVVGSRRYQQYFERQVRGDGSALIRLPILWHILAQRWLPLDTVFLEPDRDEVDSHAATWNDSCILCHNTGPEPRLADPRDPVSASRFDSRVAELGIACESCHGPAAEHGRVRRDPLARYREHLGVSVAAAAVLPTHLEQERAIGVCGQCHGARLPQPLHRIRAWLTTGPTYRPGDLLSEHATPITAATPVLGNTDPAAFALRFWSDGTPRLTAYEYQGIKQSACYLRGAMTCSSCHSMHAGDPRGQMRPDIQGNATCTQCHEKIARDLTGHTHHVESSAGSSCVECHMPRIVYGVTELHRSHRIDSPDAEREALSGRPHACTLCHVDRSPLWAGEQLRTLWGERFRVPATRRDRAPIDLPDAIASLHAGDAAARAVYAAAIGRPTATFADGAAAPLRAHLAVAMGDGYPMVRWLAQRSLASLEERRPSGLSPLLAGIDHTSGEGSRRVAVEGLLDFLATDGKNRMPVPMAGMLMNGDCRLQLGLVIRLTNLQSRNLISIGE
jgi:predicted CXXCH cytochrome family protein